MVLSGGGDSEVFCGRLLVGSERLGEGRWVRSRRLVN